MAFFIAKQFNQNVYLYRKNTMDEYQPAGDLSQSVDGKTLWFTETNTDPPQEICSKTLIVADGYNRPVLELCLGYDETSVSFEIEKDGYYGITLVWVGEDETEYTGYVGTLSTRLHDNAQLYNQIYPRPQQSKFVNNYMKAQVYRDYALEAFNLGNSELSQSLIENATKMVTRAPQSFLSTLTATPIVKQVRTVQPVDDDLLTYDGHAMTYGGAPLNYDIHNITL